MVALSLLCWSICLCFRYFDRFRTLSCNFHPASSNFPPSIPLIFLNFPPSINPLLHALKTELFFPPRVCSSATPLFVHFQKYLHTPKQYSSIQQRILAWTNSSRRARRHVWCWVEFHPHHCLRVDSGNDNATVATEPARDEAEPSVSQPENSLPERANDSEPLSLNSLADTKDN